MQTSAASSLLTPNTRRRDHSRPKPPESIHSHLLPPRNSWQIRFFLSADKKGLKHDAK